MLLAAIDWSLTCPAIFIGGEGYVTRIHSISKKHMGKYLDDSIILHDAFDWKDNQDRFDKMTDWAVNVIKTEKTEIVFIEDYAFAGNGRITDIAECVGVLKHKLYKEGLMVVPVSPSSVKKTATGKGNATKDMMVDAFIEKTGINLFETFGINRTQKIPSPIQDIVDAYWIGKHGTHIVQTNT